MKIVYNIFISPKTGQKIPFTLFYLKQQPFVNIIFEKRAKKKENFFEKPYICRFKRGLGRFCVFLTNFNNYFVI